MLSHHGAVKVPYKHLRYPRGMAKREINDRLREHICSLVEQWAAAGESNAEIARSLGVERPTVGAIRNEGVAGLRVAMAVAKRLGLTVEELERAAPLGGGVNHRATVRSETHPALGSIRGADVALVKAKKREPFFPAFAWEDSFATAPLITPPYVDEDMLIHAARLAISLRSATERDEAEGKRVDDEEAAREARQVEADRRVREAAARGEKLVPAKVMTQIRKEQEAQEIEAARARDAAKGVANDAPPPAAPDTPAKVEAKKGPGGKRPKK